MGYGKARGARGACGDWVRVRTLFLGGRLGEGVSIAELKSCFQLLRSYGIGPSETLRSFCTLPTAGRRLAALLAEAKPPQSSSFHRETAALFWGEEVICREMLHSVLLL